jgi:RHS repeat-associated protein
VAKDQLQCGRCGERRHDGHSVGVPLRYQSPPDDGFNVSTQQRARANIYAGGVLLAEDAPDAYLTNTPTATLLRITDNVGSLRGRQDLGSNWDGACTSFPYGDGMACTVPPLSTEQFAGKERDNESGNDFFGARYYGFSMGRFLSPDPLLNSRRPDNPQTWNRYTYGLNNPLTITDPTGLYNLINNCAGDDSKCNKAFAQDAKNLKNGLADLTKAVNGLKDGDQKTHYSER